MKPFELGLHERTLASLHAALSDEAFDAAWAEGSSTTLASLIEHASAV